MKKLFMRMINIVIRPRQEWHAIRDEQPLARTDLLRHVGILAIIPPATAVAERILAGSAAAGSQPLGYVVATNLIWYFVIIANMLITSLLVSAIVPHNDRRWISIQGMQLAGYSFTPLFLVGILLIIPRLNWLLYAAIGYSIFLLVLGIRTMTGMLQTKAVGYALASFLAAGAVVGVLNGIEYMLESYVAGKVFF